MIFTIISEFIGAIASLVAFFALYLVIDTIFHHM